MQGFRLKQSLCNFSVKPRDVEADAHVEGNLAAEISMVALDTLELVIQVQHYVSFLACLYESTRRAIAITPVSAFAFALLKC